jgi:murein DD-endopeptidase MepM/ murein hydrolase activator NlpD
MYEIQFHPADIRRQVRYYFLSRRTARWVLGGLILAALLLVAGVAMTPLGLRSVLLASELVRLQRRHDLLADVLAHRRTALDRLEVRVSEAETRLAQLAMILGIGDDQLPVADGDDATIRVSYEPARMAASRGRDMDRRSLQLLRRADALIAFAYEREGVVREVPSICPLPIGSFVLTSPFGDRVSPFTNSVDFHAGIDLAAREGTPVLAPGDARVVFAGRFPHRRNVRWWRYGNVVVLRHGDVYLTIYAHLQDIGVRRGQTVERGEEIGTVGNSGWSTSPHLHYEVRALRDGEDEPVPMDPRIYILNYRWRGHEEVLAAGRYAPPPVFDPLPSRISLR